MQDINELREQLTATRTALAAAEAREMKLISDLSRIISFITTPVKDETPYVKTLNCAIDAIALPRDDSALRRLLAEAKAGVYEECEKELIRLDYLFAPDAIRALAEKAKEEEC